MKKKIGISFTTTNFQNYINWFTREDLEGIELVVLSFEKNNVADISGCDGFILTGGIDIHPGFYGGTMHYNHLPDSFQTDRDNFEKDIYYHAKAHELPVLGICRGFQLINILEGGSLIQDLGEKGNAAHKKEIEDKEHDVEIEKDTLLYEIAFQTKGYVNSAHHQGLDQNNLSSELRANAYAKTGIAIVEGFEFKNRNTKPFLLGVQWHPERMRGKESNPLSQKIKERFLEEIRK